MARYILIDNYTGYVFADSADINGAIFDGTPVELAQALDRSLGVAERVYDEVWRLEAGNVGGYLVYRADINGSEAIPVVWDGQDQETIDAVVSQCEYLGALRVAA